MKKVSGNQVNTHFSYERPEKADIPLILTKKWLCSYFGMVYPSGRLSYTGLHRHVLTMSILQIAQIKNARRKGPGVFDAEESERLKKALSIS